MIIPLSVYPPTSLRSKRFAEDAFERRGATGSGQALKSDVD